MPPILAMIASDRPEELPRVSDIKRYKQDPRDGTVYVLRQIILREDEWRACPESGEGDWEVTRFGPIVVATRITFLTGMRMQGEDDGGG